MHEERQIIINAHINKHTQHAKDMRYANVVRVCNTSLQASFHITKRRRSLLMWSSIMLSTDISDQSNGNELQNTNTHKE